MMTSQPSNKTGFTPAYRYPSATLAARLSVRLGLVALLSSGTTFANDAADTQDTYPNGDFSKGSLSGWTERSFTGNTDYSLVDEGDFKVLKGHSEAQASIFYREKSVDLSETPIISWSWKVDRTFDDIDEQTKEGDDFPARLYVVVQTGMLPWDTQAINYVWSSNNAIDESWDNPFTDKAKMIVVQSGDAHVGQWVMETRDIAADFKEQFGIDVDEIDGYAVMVDGDNSGNEATAWFGQISFNPR